MCLGEKRVGGLLAPLMSGVGARCVVWRVKGSLRHAEELGLSQMGPERSNTQMDKVQIIGDLELRPQPLQQPAGKSKSQPLQQSGQKGQDSVNASQLPNFLSLLPIQDQSRKMPYF